MQVADVNVNNGFAIIMQSRLRPRLTPIEKEEQIKRIKLHKEQQALAFEKRPFINFKGKVIYHTELMDCALICDNLLEKAKKANDLVVVGFDMEWSFSYQTGPGRTAVIQISPDLESCYILHVSQLKNLPKSLSEFLAHQNVRITGNNIKNDIRKLARDFHGFDGDTIVKNCIDLGVFANSVLPIRQRWSMEALVDHILEMKIFKGKKVRMSEWHKIPLTKAQRKYAAIDAYVSLLLYQKLKEREVQKNEIVEDKECF